MSLLVYVPNTSEANPLETLKRVGLYELHDDGPACMGAAVNANGPDGGGGALIGWPGVGEVLVMDRTRQEWHALKPHGELPAGRAWIGWDKSKPPGPETLKRTKQLGGRVLSLQDGRPWLIPIARQLPMLLGLADDGSVSPTVAPAYQAFWESSYGMLAKFTAEADGPVTVAWSEGYEYCVSALSVNYRMSRDLAALLGVIGSEHFWAIPKAVCEYDRLVEFIEKKNP